VVELSFDFDAYNGNFIVEENKSCNSKIGESHVMEEGINITMCKWNLGHSLILMV